MEQSTDLHSELGAAAAVLWILFHRRQVRTKAKVIPSLVLIIFVLRNMCTFAFSTLM